MNQTKVLPAILLLLIAQIQYAQLPELKPAGENFIKILANDCLQFDLSGIARDVHGNIYVVADKSWNNSIYQIDTSENNWHIVKQIKYKPKRRFDCEGIDINNNNFIIINEYGSEIFEINKEGVKKKIPINWRRNKINNKTWENAGLEGVAFDSLNNQLYLAKEREPAFIYKLDLKSGKITEITKDYKYFNKNSDYTDLKYENNALYVLERGLCRVTKINFTTNKVISYSFASTFHPDEERVFEVKDNAHGLAEALLLTEKEIWIGMDNNGRPVTEFGKSIGLKGNKPLIAVFIRPEGF